MKRSERSLSVKCCFAFVTQREHRRSRPRHVESKNHDYEYRLVQCVLTRKRQEVCFRDLRVGCFRKQGGLRSIFFLSSIFAATMLSSSAIADEARFIGDLEAEQKNWDRLIGIPLVIEGRVSAVSRGKLRLVGSRLQVQTPPSASPRGGQPYRIQGEFRKGDVLPEFIAVKIKEIPSDSDRMRVARSRLKQDDSSGWLELADLYGKRASFYDDDGLRREVAAVEEEGLRIRATQAGDDAVAIKAVASEARSRGLIRFAAELQHQAARAEWEAISQRLSDERNDSQTDAELLLDQLLRDLPGANEPSSERREALESAYLRDPKMLFAKADDEQRRLLARFFVVEIVSRLLNFQLNETATNSDIVAGKFLKRLPDRPDLAEAVRERGLVAAMKSVATMTEPELDAFVATLRSNGAAGKADDAVDRWLKSRKQPALDRGPSALLDLADDYLRLQNNTTQAIEIYQEVLRIDSRVTAARDALARLGYEEIAGQWRKKAAMVAADPGVAVDLGEVRIGMSGGQVRGSFRTAPSSVVRIATFGEVTEIWVYRDFGQVVTLSRRGTDGEARVTDIADLE